MADAGTRDVVRALAEEIWTKHDRGAIERLVQPPLRDMVQRQFDQLLVAFPDLRCEVADVVVEGDKAAARLLLTGTHRGPFAGVAPTGRRVSYASFRFYRIEDGQLAQTWAMQDRLGLFEQLGVLNAPWSVEWGTQAQR